MQPISRELSGGAMNNLNSLLNQHQIQDIHSHGHPQMSSHFDPTSSHDDFLEQMLSSVPSWADDQPPSGLLGHMEDQSSAALLASKLRHNQISSGAAKAAFMLQQQQILLSRGLGPNNNDVVDGSSFNSSKQANDASVRALFQGSLGQTSNQSQHFHNPQAQNFGGAPAINQPAASGGSSGGQPRQRVRARRGQATDPHSIAERLRRERIAERMKGLQELVPNANKTDKASMLDEIIDYVKFLQLQVKVLSMSRLGGAGAVAPLVADMSSEGRNGNGTHTASSSNNNDGMTVTEHQVAKLMEEDMGTAMQYLQGKGLCLMPISLATAISTATCHTRNPLNSNGTTNNPLLNGEAGGPTSPSLSVLTVQSATVGGEPTLKDGNSVSKP
ncbi:hypothetical protein ACJIZ3_020649 [Penstemon smallii]|uniref:BHLH domain-containing protein n=1 Tax=Penstemon smallii TaxID=265156 RepID=A0ABD3SJU0_9LAMI